LEASKNPPQAARSLTLFEINIRALTGPVLP
jgi:hypothetical protein